jgi:hypothetical protein
MSPEVKDLIDQILLAILTGILTVGLPMLYRIAKAWAEAKIAKSRAEIAAITDQEERARAEAKLRLVEYSFSRLDHIVKNTVDEVSQAYSTQTNLSDADKNLRLKTAYARVQKQIPEQTKAILSSAVKDLDRYLITKIEANRFRQKNKAVINDRAAEARKFEEAIKRARAECK